MSRCILCGLNAVINKQDNAGRTIYNCSNCGVFVVSDIVSSEVEANKGKIASFLTMRNLSGNKDIVMISMEKVATDKSYVHMSVKQIINEFPESVVKRVEISLRNLVHKSEYPGYEIKIESLRSAPLLCIEKVNFDSMEYAVKTLERQGFVTVNHFGASSSFFPCGVIVTPEGWDQALNIGRDNSPTNEVLVTVSAGREYTEDYLKSVGYSCKIRGYTMLSTVSAGSDQDINYRLISNTRRSRFVICDLSDNPPQAFFVAGMARAYGKTAILTCRKSNKKSTGFDLSQMNVIFWDDSVDLGDYIDEAIRALIT